METLKIRKIISIGSNCIAADFTKVLGIREKGPVDNIANFYLWNANTLFDGTLSKIVFNSKYLKQESSEEEKKRNNFFNYKYEFTNGMSIVHNDFETFKFKISMLYRLINIKKFYKKSLEYDDYWYIYSLDIYDSYLTENRINEIKNNLPDVCSKRLIVLGIRAHNPLFKKYFNYYVELESEYKWNDWSQAIEIRDELYNHYGLVFEIEK